MGLHRLKDFKREIEIIFYSRDGEQFYEFDGEQFATLQEAVKVARTLIAEWLDSLTP